MVKYHIQFGTLTERVDTPDNTLHKYLVLIQGNQRTYQAPTSAPDPNRRFRTKKRTKRRRREQREHDARARTVPCEHLTLHKNIARVGPELRLDLRLRLAKRERLRLREEVGKQDAVVLRVMDRVVRRRRRDEICGDDLRSLVHKLVEGVLPVRARGAPDDWLLDCELSLRSKDRRTYAGLVVHALAVLGNRFSVRLHVSLLEVVREFVEVLVIRKEGKSLRAYL